MIPRLQALYDLLDVHPRPVPERLAPVDAWLRIHGRRAWRLGSALRELHATDVREGDAEPRPLVELLEVHTAVRWLPLVEALERRFRRSLRPLWIPIASDDGHAWVTSLDEWQHDPRLWLRQLGTGGLAPLGVTLSEHLAASLVARAPASLPFPGWLRSAPGPLVEPAVDWLLERGARLVGHGSVACVVERGAGHVARVTLDREAGRAVWFFGGTDAEGLECVLGPLVRIGLAPQGLVADDLPGLPGFPGEVRERLLGSG
ncbi:MAG: hypothetical protein AAF602_20510 [Myxococcota bacterium]